MDHTVSMSSESVSLKSVADKRRCFGVGGLNRNLLYKVLVSNMQARQDSEVVYREDVWNTGWFSNDLEF